MKILHVIPGLTRERGGPTTVVQALIREQVQAGHHVTLLTTDQGARNGEEAAEVHAGAESLRLPVRGPDRLAYAPHFAMAVRQRLQTCDLAHIHSIFTYPVHVTLREAAALGVPVVLRPCGLLHPYSLGQSSWRKGTYLAIWGRMVRRACTVWHYTSDQEAAASWPGTGKHFVLGNGIDPGEFAMNRNDARRQAWSTWPQLAQAPYVLFLGRVHPKKRLDLLLDAFLRAAPGHFKLVVAGPDECGLWPHLTQTMGPQAAHRIIRLGTVAGSDKTALLAGASLFALPSEHENFGNAPLEALAAGTPVLLSPHVDLADSAAESGLCFSEPLDLEAWQGRLRQLLAGTDELEFASPRARQWVHEHFAWRQIATELTRRYEDILARPGSRTFAGCANVVRN